MAALAAGINAMVWHETTAGICQLQVRLKAWVPLAGHDWTAHGLASSMARVRHPYLSTQ